MPRRTERRRRNGYSSSYSVIFPVDVDPRRLFLIWRTITKGCVCRPWWKYASSVRRGGDGEVRAPAGMPKSAASRLRFGGGADNNHLRRVYRGRANRARRLRADDEKPARRAANAAENRPALRAFPPESGPAAFPPRRHERRTRRSKPAQGEKASCLINSQVGSRKRRIR